MSLVRCLQRDAAIVLEVMRNTSATTDAREKKFPGCRRDISNPDTSESGLTGAMGKPP